MLVTLSLAALTGAVANLQSPLQWFPLEHPLPFFLLNTGFPTVPTIAWVLLSAALFIGAVHELNHQRHHNVRALVVFGIGFVIVSVGAMAWAGNFVWSWRIHYVGQFAVATLVIGCAVVAAETITLAIRTAIPSAGSALAFLVGLGIALMAAMNFFALMGWFRPGFLPLFYGIGLTFGLIGLALLTAGALRLCSPPPALAAGIGFLLIALGAFGGGPTSMWSYRASEAIAGIGCLVLAAVAGYVALSRPRETPPIPDSDRGLPLLSR